MGSRGRRVCMLAKEQLLRYQMKTPSRLQLLLPNNGNRFTPVSLATFTNHVPPFAPSLPVRDVYGDSST